MSEPAELGREISDRLNGLVTMTLQDRVNFILQQMLGGLRVGDNNREQVKSYLLRHFTYVEAAAREAGRREATQWRKPRPDEQFPAGKDISYSLRPSPTRIALCSGAGTIELVLDLPPAPESEGE